MNEKTGRDCSLDIMRGFAMALVVLGHSIQHAFGDNYATNPAFSFIYSFHMPFFMVLSGLSIKRLGKDTDYGWLIGKARRLVLPFFVWIILDFFISHNWKDDTFYRLRGWIVSVINDPCSGGLWFLWVLFLLCITLYVLNSIPSRTMRIGMTSALSAASIIAYVIVLKTNFLGIRNYLWYVFFFGIGYMFGNSILEWIQEKKRDFRRILIIVSFIVMVLPWRIEHGLIEKKADINALAITSINVVYAYLVPIAGTLFCMAISYYFAKLVGKVLSIIGVYSLEVYVLHTRFAKWFFDEWRVHNIAVDILLKWIIALVCSVLVAILICKISPIALLVFGKRWKKLDSVENKLLKTEKLFRFALIGALATLVDYSIYVELLSRLGPVLAKSLSMVSACCLSFVLNKLFTFENRDNVDAKMIVKYIIVQIINISVNTIVNWGMLQLTGRKNMSFVVATLCAMLVNYLLQRTVVFAMGCNDN